MAADDGVFYAVDNSGSLIWYQHTGGDDGTPTWTSRGARYPVGQSTRKNAGVVHFGPDGVLDTDAPAGSVRSPASIHLVAAPDQAHGFRHGFWTAADGDIWLRWYDGTSASSRIRVRSAAGRSDVLDVDLQTGVVNTR